MREQVLCARCHKPFFSQTMKTVIIIDYNIETKDKKPVVYLVNPKIGKRVSYLVTNFLPQEARTTINNSIELMIEEKMSEASIVIPKEMLCQRCSNYVRQKADLEKSPRHCRIIPMKKHFEFLKS